MDDYTDNENQNAESHSILMDRILHLEPPTAGCDLPIEENNNLPGAGGNTCTNCIRSLPTPHVSRWDLIFLIIPLLIHLYNFVNDIYMTAEYFSSLEIIYGCLTLAFIIIPAITYTWMSSRMHDEDFQEVQAEMQDGRSNYFEKILALRTNCVMDILFQLALPLRRLRSLYYAWKVRQCEQNADNDGLNRYYPKMLKEQEDLALLNVIESFLESAPQLVVQLTILLMEDRAMTTTMWFRVVGGCVTLVSLGWCMRNYHHKIRLAHLDKDVVTSIGSALLFIWHFGTISARIFLTGIAASNWLLYTLLTRTLIWMGWTVYLYNVDGVFVFCRNKTVSPWLSHTLPEKMRTSFFASVLAVIFMFTFVNLEEGRTHLRYTIYHILCGLENITVLALWVKFASQCCEDAWFSEYLLIISVIFYMIGIAALVTYYFFRPHTIQNRFFMSGAEDHSSPPIVCQ